MPLAQEEAGADHCLFQVVEAYTAQKKARESRFALPVPGKANVVVTILADINCYEVLVIDYSIFVNMLVRAYSELQLPPLAQF
jgi:hypothetical protein